MENPDDYRITPYPKEDIEIAVNLVAEMRADMWYWEKKRWYLKYKIKENTSNDFLFRFYKDLLIRVEKIIDRIYKAQSDTRYELSGRSFNGEKLLPRILMMADDIIKNNPRENKNLELKNQPFPMPFKISYE
ncbi:hypothetical protein OA066_03090 [SAR86 cluster bacterium]|nr:hypothetical protein [SAR86 cluster bacterium]